MEGKCFSFALLCYKWTEFATTIKKETTRQVMFSTQETKRDIKSVLVFVFFCDL